MDPQSPRALLASLKALWSRDAASRGFKYLEYLKERVRGAGILLAWEWPKVGGIRVSGLEQISPSKIDHHIHLDPATIPGFICFLILISP